MKSPIPSRDLETKDLIGDAAAGIEPSASGPLGVVLVTAPASFFEARNRICRSMLQVNEVYEEE